MKFTSRVSPVENQIPVIHITLKNQIPSGELKMLGDKKVKYMYVPTLTWFLQRQPQTYLVTGKRYLKLQK